MTVVNVLLPFAVLLASAHANDYPSLVVFSPELGCAGAGKPGTCFAKGGNACWINTNFKPDACSMCQELTSSQTLYVDGVGSINGIIVDQKSTKLFRNCSTAPTGPELLIPTFSCLAVAGTWN